MTPQNTLQKDTTIANIKKMYLSSYTKSAFNKASGKQKFFYNLTNNTLVGGAVYFAVALPLIMRARMPFLMVGVAAGTIMLQTYLSNKFGVKPIEKVANKDFENDMTSGVLLDQYVTALSADDFQKKHRKMKIKDTAAEIANVESLRQSFKNAKTSTNDNTPKQPPKAEQTPTPKKKRTWRF